MFVGITSITTGRSGYMDGIERGERERGVSIRCPFLRVGGVVSQHRLGQAYFINRLSTGTLSPACVFSECSVILIIINL